MCCPPQQLEREYPWFADEDAGVIHRVDNYYVPLFNDFFNNNGIRFGDAKVLDCGCGNGLSVERLSTAGISAFGLDLWDVRPMQWRDRLPPEGTRCLTADATRLPFEDNTFDIVFSCGLLEHIGVHEQWEPRYAVEPAVDQAQVRNRFFEECLRVLKKPGALYVDHPNGMFPIDFWHDNLRTGGRPHWPSEMFLPNYRQLVDHVAAAGGKRQLEAISPAGRFLYKQVGERWWGRLFSKPFEAFYSLMRLSAFRWLARSPLNPYLVVRVENV